jgi:pyruvate decarboxylase
MGVPGDMNLELLDYIKQVEGLSWGVYKGICVVMLTIRKDLLKLISVGNANELNAAYAADGYARVKDCPGVSRFTNRRWTML